MNKSIKWTLHSKERGVFWTVDIYQNNNYLWERYKRLSSTRAGIRKYNFYHKKDKYSSLLAKNAYFFKNFLKLTNDKIFLKENYEISITSE